MKTLQQLLAGQTLREHLQRGSAYIDAMNLRERTILTCMLSLLSMAAFQTLWWGHIDSERKLGKQQLEQLARTNEALWKQAESLRAAHENNPNDALRARLDKLHKDLQQADEGLTQAADELMRPRNIPLLLHNMVASQPGLTLRRVETLPVATVNIRGEVVTDAQKTEEGVLFRHGLEVEIAGSYQTLYRWINDIEKVPGFIQWDSLYYTVESPASASGAPQARMVIRLYTMSVKEVWLDV